MGSQLRRIAFTAMAAACVCTSQAHAERGASGDSPLHEHLLAAQSLQRSGKLDQAAAQYRAFLAEAIGKLAIEHARNGNYAKAASYFDESLAIEPNSPHLRLEYARAALVQGDLSRAETLTQAFPNDDPHDSQAAATAHQILGRALLKMNRDQDAKKELEAAVALDPSFENGYDLAVVCLDLDNEKCASQVFGEMEASFGDTPEIHMSFGRAYGDSDFAPKAVAEFRKVIAKNARFPGAHYSLAAALLGTSDDPATIQSAEKELEEELAISPNDSLTYAALGKLASSQHRYAEAEKYLKRAASLNEKNPDAFLYLGQLYFDTDQSADAIAVLRRAIELTRDESRNHYQVQKAHFLLGRILMQEHREEEAHAEMKLSRAIANKGLSQDKRNLAGTLSNGAGTMSPADASKGWKPTFEQAEYNPDPATTGHLNELEKQLAPAIADGYNNLGAITATSGHYTDSLSYFERAGKWNPSLEGLDLNWGRAAFMASRFSDAAQPLSRYLRLHPDDSGIRSALAMSKFMTEDYQGCIDTFGNSVNQIASIPQMQYVFAESLVKTGHVSSGVERLQSLEALHPEIADVHRALGEALESRGERERAVKELRASLRLNTKDPEAHYALGKVELDMGDAIAAVQELESAIQIWPDDPKFHRELSLAYKAALRPADAEKELLVANKLVTHPVQPQSPISR